MALRPFPRNSHEYRILDPVSSRDRLWPFALSLKPFLFPPSPSKSWNSRSKSRNIRSKCWNTRSKIWITRSRRPSDPLPDLTR